MANDFDQFPLYDALVKVGSLRMSDVWVSFMSTFYMNLIGYLSQNGIFLPQLTTAQRNAIQTPQNGQMIYNTSTNEIQVWQVKTGTGAWRVVTTTP